MQNVGTYVYIYLFIAKSKTKATRTEQCMNGHRGYSASKSLHGNRYLTIRCWIILSHVPPLSTPIGMR